MLALMAVVCAIVDSSLEKHYFPLGAPWLYGDDHKGDNPRINGLITWTYSLLTYVVLLLFVCRPKKHLAFKLLSLYPYISPSSS